MRDELAEQATALRPVVDPGYLGLVQPGRDETGQPPALADDAQRAVPGIDQGDRGLDDVPEHGFQVQLRADGDHGLQQGVRPVPGVDHRLQPRLQLVQQVIDPQLRHQRVSFRGFHISS